MGLSGLWMQVLFYFKRHDGKAKQLSDLLATMIVAAEDDEIAEEEFQKIVAQAKALLDPGRLEG
jgi:cytochrome c peroxidase